MPWGVIFVVIVVVVILWGVIGATTAGTGNTPSTPAGCDGCHTLRAWWNSLRPLQKVLQFAHFQARRTDCWLRCKISV